MEENNKFIYDYPEIINTYPKYIFKPTNIKELQKILFNNYNSNKPLKISIAGSKCSHGGHTLNNDGIILDMCNLKKIKLNNNLKTVSCQSGVIWLELIKYLDKFNLSVAEMQSYCNFNIAGSISVNAHGRGLEYGTVGDTVIEMIVMLSNGKILRTIPNDDLFKAIIGGYGGIAIILEVKLLITNNYKIKQIIKISDNFEFTNDVIFYNTYVYPKNINKYVNIYWIKTDNELTINDRIQNDKIFHFDKMFLEQLVRRIDIFKFLRSIIEPNQLKNNKIVYRNYEMSLNINELKTLFKFPTTSILQEYFIPIDKCHIFIKYFWVIITKYDVNLINLSIRYVKKTNIPILNYAVDNKFAFVLYLNIGNNNWSLKYLRKWTRIMIDLVLYLNGTYYLPYLPLASIEQFRKAYPNWKEYLKIKNKYDNKNILSNLFLDKYLI